MQGLRQFPFPCSRCPGRWIPDDRELAPHMLRPAPPPGRIPAAVVRAGRVCQASPPPATVRAVPVLSAETSARALFGRRNLSGMSSACAVPWTIPVARYSPPAAPPPRFHLSRPVFSDTQRPGQRVLAGRPSSRSAVRTAPPRMPRWRALGAGATAAFGVPSRDPDRHVACHALTRWRSTAIRSAPPPGQGFHPHLRLSRSERHVAATVTTRSEYEGVLAALAGSDRRRRWPSVTEFECRAPAPQVAAAPRAGLPNRFLERRREGGCSAGARRSPCATASLEIGPSDVRSAELRALTACKLDLAAAIDQFETGSASMASRAIDVKGRLFDRVRARLATTPASNSELHHREANAPAAGRRRLYYGLITHLDRRSRFCRRSFSSGSSADSGSAARWS